MERRKGASVYRERRYKRREMATSEIEIERKKGRKGRRKVEDGHDALI